MRVYFKYSVRLVPYLLKISALSKKIYSASTQLLSAGNNLPGHVLGIHDNRSISYVKKYQKHVSHLLNLPHFIMMLTQGRYSSLALLDVVEGEWEWKWMSVIEMWGDCKFHDLYRGGCGDTLA